MALRKLGLAKVQLRQQESMESDPFGAVGVKTFYKDGKLVNHHPPFPASPRPPHPASHAPTLPAPSALERHGRQMRFLFEAELEELYELQAIALASDVINQASACRRAPRRAAASSRFDCSTRRVCAPCAHAQARWRVSERQSIGAARVGTRRTFPTRLWPSPSRVSLRSRPRQANRNTSRAEPETSGNFHDDVRDPAVLALAAAPSTKHR